MSESKVSRVASIFNSMEYGSAIDSETTAQAWLDRHQRHFGHFINNQWTSRGTSTDDDGTVTSCDIMCRSSCRRLATVLLADGDECDAAVRAARAAATSWGNSSGHERAACLHSMSRVVRKYSSMCAVIEALNTGRTVRETSEHSIAGTMRVLHQGANLAVSSHLYNDDDRQQSLPSGVVAVIVEGNYTLLSLVSRLAPILAAANAVVVCLTRDTPLATLLFAEICVEAGLPEGVLNVVSVDSKQIGVLATSSSVDQVVFIGPCQSASSLRQLTAHCDKPLTFELIRGSAMIVFDSADLHAAVDAAVDAVCCSQAQWSWCGVHVLVHQSVYERVVAALTRRLDSVRVGLCLDRCVDMAASLPSVERHAAVTQLLQRAGELGAEIYQSASGRAVCADLSASVAHFYLPPTLISSAPPMSWWTNTITPLPAPLLVVSQFRTPREAITLLNDALPTTPVGLFTHQMALALHTAQLLHTDTVWVNCHCRNDSGSLLLNNTGRALTATLLEYRRPRWQQRRGIFDCPPNSTVENYGKIKDVCMPTAIPSQDKECDTVTYKLYFDGVQKESSDKCTDTVFSPAGNAIGRVSIATSGDVQNAIASSCKAQSAWAQRPAFERSEILLSLADHLGQHQEQLVQCLMQSMGASRDDAEKEVEAGVRRVREWTALAETYCGGASCSSLPVGSCMITRHRMPLGVVALFVDDVTTTPLLATLSLLAPLLALANSVLLLPPSSHPLPVLQLINVLQSCNMAAGLVSIMSGGSAQLTRAVACNAAVNAVWFHQSSPEGARFVQHAAAGGGAPVKRTWVSACCDWSRELSHCFVTDLLARATRDKTVFLPSGDLFAN